MRTHSCEDAYKGLVLLVEILRQHTSAYVSKRQHTSANVSIRLHHVLLVEILLELRLL